MTDYTEWVSKLMKAGFVKVCVINKSYQIVGASAQDHIPSAWNNDKGVLVNENQTLADDWSGEMTTICFFKMKFNVIRKDKDFVVAASGNDILIGKEFSSVWVMSQGQKKGGMLDKDADASKKKGAFNDAPDAYNKACNCLFDEVEEDEE